MVGDVRVSFRLEVARAGTLTVNVREHGRAHRLVLGKDESYAVAVTDSGEHRFPIDVRLRDGGAYDVSFANLDDALLVAIDGDAEAELEQPFPDQPNQPRIPPHEVRFRDPSGSGSPWWDHAIGFDATGIRATLTELRIDRDIYYDQEPHREGESPDDIWKIPQRHYFMMGDNTRSSSDSRKWECARVDLKDGTVIRWQEPDPNSSEPIDNPSAGSIVFGEDREFVINTDVDGLTRRFRGTDVAGEPESRVASPFVPEDHLVGRAFAIFWPIHIPRLVTGPTRVDLIR
jgi:hypothetical protein